VKPILVRGPKDAREERGPDCEAKAIGLYGLRLDPSDKSATLKLSAPEELPPARATKVHVDALVQDAAGTPPRIVSTDVELPTNGKEATVQWSGDGWSGG
jgi:hypothetical protein